MLQVEIIYSDHSCYFGNGGNAPNEAKAHLEKMVNFYQELNYTIHSAVINQYCDDCIGGSALKCRSPRRHVNGYHDSVKCFKRCLTCHGNYTTRIY